MLKRLKKEFELLGGVIDDSADANKFCELRKAEALTFNEELILLSKEASTSAVYEEIVHARQFREGKFNKWANEYGNNLATYLMEKEAAEELLINAAKWKIPTDEIEIIRQRLLYFNEKLKGVENL